MSGWVPIDAAWWPEIAGALERPWPREAVFADLRWWEDRVRMGWEQRMPGRRALSARWGWTERQARSAISADGWASPVGASHLRPGSVPPASQERPAGSSDSGHLQLILSQPRPGDVPPASHLRPTPLSNPPETLGIQPPSETETETETDNKRRKASQAKQVDPDGVGARLARFLLDEIRRHSPDVAEAKTPKQLEGWARDLDRLARLGPPGSKAPQNPGEICRVIRWAHRSEPRGSFSWRQNLLSGRKVRQHYERLLVGARDAGALRKAPAGSTADDWIGEHHRFLRRWIDEPRASEANAAALCAACDAEGIPHPPEPEKALRWAHAR